jgi:hypothetical protein
MARRDRLAGRHNAVGLDIAFVFLPAAYVPFALIGTVILALVVNARPAAPPAVRFKPGEALRYA